MSYVSGIEGSLDFQAISRHLDDPVRYPVVYQGEDIGIVTRLDDVQPEGGWETSRPVNGRKHYHSRAAATRALAAFADGKAASR